MPLRSRRRALLAVLAGALALLGAQAPGAYALDTTTDTSLTVDGDVHYMNGSYVLTNGDWQYTAYWDAEDSGTGKVYLKLTRRKHSDDTLQSIRFDGVGGNPEDFLDDFNDGHNTVAIGLSPNDGRVHISFSNHNEPHHYWISSAGCLSQANLSSCTFSFANFQADRTAEGTLTYPIYFNDQQGRLYFAYRYGSALNGAEYLNTYEDDGTWSAIGRMIDGRTGGENDPDGTWIDTDRDRVRDPGEPGFLDRSRTRGVYMQGLEFDKNDRLHMMWNWREELRAQASEAYLQHGINYAYSDDYGVTWRDNAGRAIATTESDALVVGDTSLEVVTLGVGTRPLGWGIGLDSLNQPHVILPTSSYTGTDDVLANMLQTHVWRTTSGSWYSSNVTTGDGTAYQLGDFMFDQGDGLYFNTSRNELDWIPYNANGYVQAELRNANVTWQGGDFLNVVPSSAVTALDTSKYVGISIGTARNQNYKITVSLKNNTVGTAFQIYWQTDASQRWDVSRGQSFTIRANRAVYDTYTFTVTDADWTGTLRALEIYPAGLGDVHGAGKDISIDYIRITDDRVTPVTAKAWEFRQGVHVLTTYSSPTGNWSRWDAQSELLAGVSDATTDAVYQVDQQLYRDSKVVSFLTLQQGAPGTETMVVHDFDILGDDVILNRGFDVDTQGWTAGRDISGFGWSDDSGTKVVGGTLTGNDSRILSVDNLSVPIGASDDRVVIRLKNSTTARTAKLYFITDSDTTWNEAKSQTVAITPSSGYTDYTLDMRSVTGWTGTLRQLRLDPSDDAGVTSGSFKLDRIYIAP